MDSTKEPSIEKKKDVARTLILSDPKIGLQPGSKFGSANFWFQKTFVENVNLFFKIIFIGPSKCGKTTLIRQYIEGAFDREYIPTFGMQNSIKNVEKSGKSVKLVLWDTPNYSKFQPQIEKNYETSDAIIFVYDQTDIQIIEEMQEIMVEIAERVKDKEIVMIALLNVKNSKYTVIQDTNLSREILEKYPITTMKVNAANRERVRGFYDELLDILCAKHEKIRENLLEKFYEENQQRDEDEDEEENENENQDKALELASLAKGRSNEEVNGVGSIELYKTDRTPKQRTQVGFVEVGEKTPQKEEPAVIMETELRIEGPKNRGKRAFLNPCCTTGTATTANCGIF